MNGNGGCKVTFSGYYVSPKGFEKYDQTFFNYLLRFFEDGTIKKGIESRGNFHEIGSCTYAIDGSVVTCLISSAADGFKSTWIGEVSSGCIQFKIQDPDFEDIPGEYAFSPRMQA